MHINAVSNRIITISSAVARINTFGNRRTAQRARIDLPAWQRDLSIPPLCPTNGWICTTVMACMPRGQSSVPIAAGRLLNHAGVVERLRPFLVENAAAGFGRRLFPLQNASSWRKTGKMMRSRPGRRPRQMDQGGQDRGRKPIASDPVFWPTRVRPACSPTSTPTGTALSPRSVGPGSRWRPPRSSPAIRRRD